MLGTRHSDVLVQHLLWCIGDKNLFKILTSSPRSQLKSNPGSESCLERRSEIWTRVHTLSFDFPAAAQTCFEFSKPWCWSRFSSFLSCLGFGFEQRIEGDARSRADRHFSGTRSTSAENPCDAIYLGGKSWGRQHFCDRRPPAPATTLSWIGGTWATKKSSGLLGEVEDSP